MDAATIGAGQGWLERVRTIGPALDRAAADNLGASELSPDVVRMIDDAGVFAMMAPQVVGGAEAHPRDLIEVISELSYWDGSAGWYAHAVMTGGSVAGAFLGEKAVAAIFPGGRFQHVAGQAAPTGKAVPEGEGYRVSGRYSFASGSPHAKWIVGGYMADGTSGPTMLIGVLPREAVEFRGNWDVLGLRGTGSYDFVVEDQWLHADFIHDTSAPVQRRGGALYRMGFMAMPCISHGSFALGAARRMLDEWLAFAQSKLRGGGAMQSDGPIFHRDFALLTAELRAAEAYFRKTFDDLYDAAEAGSGPIPSRLQIDGRLSTSHAMQVAVRIATAAYTSATTTALRNGSTIQRVFRDIQAGNAHFLTAEQSVIDAGAALAGTDGAKVVF